jgi:hypothetical protein
MKSRSGLPQVTAREFPTGVFSPYSISADEEKDFLSLLKKNDLPKAAMAVEENLEERLSSAPKL